MPPTYETGQRRGAEMKPGVFCWRAGDNPLDEQIACSEAIVKKERTQ